MNTQLSFTDKLPIFMKMAEVAKAAKEYDFSQGEQKKALEIAANLKSMGLSVEQIVQATNLSSETINSL